MDCAFCDKQIANEASWCPYCGTQVGDAAEGTDYTYEAFISYRHLPLDRQVAVKIQRAIEGYRIPKQLIGEDGKKRLGKCFRDEDELPTSASLSEQIEDALRHSRYLVVVCTKETRNSLWVLREVETFASYHGRDRILVALAEGEPSESFPPLLLSRTEKNEVGELVEMPREPIAADFRDLKRSKFNVEKLRIISQLLGCNFDDLRQREKARRNKIIATAASGIAAVSLAFGGFATYQQMQIAESYRQIQIKESEFLATEANDLLAQGDRYQAIQVALAALPESSTSNDRPYVPAAQMALEQALGIYMNETEWTSRYSQTNVASDASSDIVFSDNGLEAYVNTNYRIEVHEATTGSLMCVLNPLDLLEGNVYDLGDETTTPLAMAFAGDRLIVTYYSTVCCFDTNDGSLVWSNEVDGIIGEQESLAISSDGTAGAYIHGEWSGMEDVNIDVFDTETGDITDTFSFPGYDQPGRDLPEYYEVPSLVFSPDDSKLAMGVFGYLYQVDLASGSTDDVEPTYGAISSLAYVGDLIASVSQADTDALFGPIPYCIDVYDEDLELLWTYKDDLDGSEPYSDVKVCGEWDYSENGSGQLVSIFGNDLLLLGKKKGDTVLTIELESPILDCVVAQGRGNECLFICTRDGGLMFRDPRKINDGYGFSGYDITLGLETFENGDFFVCDGRVYCSLVDASTSKHMVFRFFESDDIAGNTDLEAMYGMDDPSHFYWNGTVLAVQDSSSIHFLDQNTFELITSFDLNGLDELDVSEDTNLEMALDEAGDAFVIAQRIDSDYSDLVLYRIGYKDGSAEPLVSFDETNIESIEAVDLADGSTRLLVGIEVDYDYHVLVIDPGLDESKRIVCDITLDDIFNYSWYANDKVYVSVYGSGSYENLTVFDSQTGERVDCDLSSYYLTENTLSEYAVALTPDGSKLVMACADGYLRCFDTANDKLIWETSQTSPSIHFVAFGEMGDVFVQDSYGQSVLVSGKTGEVLASSTTVLPLVSGAWYREGTNELLLQFSYLQGTHQGLALITMDPEMFGPKSIIYGGLVVSPDDGRFAYTNGYPPDLHMADKLSLDELIALANETIAGHELTDAERYLYQVAN